jgi:lysozyme
MMPRNSVFLLAVGASLAAIACSREVPGEDVGASGAELERAGEVCAAAKTLTGVDVSHHNDEVAWTKVKGSGRSFAFARVSDGVTHPDTQFATNWPAMKKVGLVRGAYQFFRPTRDPIAQADLLLSKLAAAGGLAKGDLPPVLDLEVTDDNPASVVVSKAKAWLSYVESKSGVKPIVYTGNNMSETIGTNFADYVLWVAHYKVTCPRIPAGWSTWQFWQDGEAGSVPGVGGEVDTDFFNGTLADLNALTIPATVALDDAPPPPTALADDGDGARMGDGIRAAEAR